MSFEDVGVSFKDASGANSGAAAGIPKSEIEIILKISIIKINTHDQNTKLDPKEILAAHASIPANFV